MLKPFKWYQFSDKECLTMFTSFNEELGGGNGIRLNKAWDGWKIDVSTNYQFTANELYHEIDIKKFKISIDFFRLFIKVIFESHYRF